MKTVITLLATFAVILFIVFALPVSGEEAVYDGVLRLHVLADSDSTEHQTEKLLVRDAILSAYGEDFSALQSREEAVAFAEAHLDDIKALTETVTDSPVAVSLEEEWFDTRAYDGFTLPAGRYLSLTVHVGSGKGQNFFCMLYPALCVEPAKGERLSVSDAKLNEAEYLLITDGGYGLKFRTLELLSSLFE